MLSGVTVCLVCGRRRRLTAFVVRCFNQAKGYIFIDQGKVNQAVDFILQQQNRDGTFRVSSAIPTPTPLISRSRSVNHGVEFVAGSRLRREPV